MKENELNKLVAKAIYGRNTSVHELSDDSSEIILHRMGYAPVLIDWVHDKALHFQLALDNRISLLVDTGDFVATTNSLKALQGLKSDDYFIFRDIYPGRAIVKCFLSMRGVEIA